MTCLVGWIARVEFGFFVFTRIGVAGRHIVWGLTFRFLERMLEVIEHPFPAKWGNVSEMIERHERESAQSNR